MPPRKSSRGTKAESGESLDVRKTGCNGGRIRPMESE